SEDGEDGMDGLQGEQGEQGEQGSAGEDGSTILAGSGGPTASIGVMGDYYINQDTRELYGPKIDATTWGSPISLRGASGADGADGSQILSGTSAPTTSLGQDGDYYLRANTYDLYGPKTSGAWGSPINLKGSTDVMY